MLAKTPTIAAVLAAGALVLPAGAMAQGGGGVLLSGYAPPGVSEESALGAPSGSKPAAHASSEATAPITADALAAKARPAGVGVTPGTTPGVTTTGPSTAGGATQAASRQSHTRRAATASPSHAGAAAHAQAAVVEAAARGAGPASGLGGIWIFGGAVLVLAGAFTALWRGRTR